MEKNLHLGLGRVIQGQNDRANRPVSGRQQELMTIFSAFMSINYRPPCISYTRAALKGTGGEGPGRFPSPGAPFFEVGSHMKTRRQAGASGAVIVNKEASQVVRPTRLFSGYKATE